MMTHIPDTAEWEGSRFHHNPQFKTYELFASGIFHFVLSGGRWPLEARTLERKSCGCVSDTRRFRVIPGCEHAPHSTRCDLHFTNQAARQALPC